MQRRSPRAAASRRGRRGGGYRHREFLAVLVLPLLLLLAAGAAAEAATDAWSVWQKGARLRGAGLHPCRVFHEGRCREPITLPDVRALRSLGANVINASYPGVFAERSPYAVNPTALQYLDDLIQWAEAVGIYVVIHYRTGPGRNESAIHMTRGARFDVWTDRAAHDAWVEMWRFTARRYRASPVVIGYDLMVEPHVNVLVDPDAELSPREVQAKTRGTLKDWNAFSAEITAAIRAVDPDTPIIVSSLNWGGAAWFESLVPTGDPRTIYSVHNYAPDAYTNQEPGEISISYPSVVEHEGETIRFDRTWQEEHLRPVADFARRHGVPIYVGEFGAFRWVPGAEQFVRDQTELFERHGWSYCVYVWRGDETHFDGFNLEYGTKPTDHDPVPDNPLLRLFRERWSKNGIFPKPRSGGAPDG
jgi:hypothetical protein